MQKLLLTIDKISTFVGQLFSWLIVALTVVVLAGLAPCPGWAGAAKSGEVVAYVSMTERDIAPMQEAFKKATGLDVKVVVIPIGQAATRIKVKRDRVIPVCKALLDELPVTDIDIQEVPIEEVIRRIFAR